jgi:hypothetical protein
MALRYCFFIGTGLFRRKICIDVPVLYDPFWKIKHPDWIHFEDVNKVAVKDLVTIATMAQLISTLGNDSSKELFQSAMKNAVMALDLPSEISIELGGHVIRKECEQKMD